MTTQADHEAARLAGLLLQTINGEAHRFLLQSHASDQARDDKIHISRHLLEMALGALELCSLRQDGSHAYGCASHGRTSLEWRDRLAAILQAPGAA